MSDREQLELEPLEAAAEPPAIEGAAVPGVGPAGTPVQCAADAPAPAPPQPAESPQPAEPDKTQPPVAVPLNQRKAVSNIATTVTGVTVCVFIAVVNLDVVAQWFVQNDNLLESVFCLQTMTSIETLMGVKNWRLANAYSTLGSCYSKLGRYGDAIKSEWKARDLMAAIEGPDSQNVYVLDAELAQFMSHNKQYAQAEVLLKDTLERLDRLHLPTPWSKAYTMAVLLDIYLQEKKQPEAEALALQLVPIDDRMQVETSYASYSPRSRLCSLYCKSGRLDEAEEMARQGLQISQGSSNPLTRSGAHETLGRVMLMRGNSDEARKEFDESIKEMKRKYGADDERIGYWRSRYDEFLKQKNPYLE